MRTLAHHVRNDTVHSNASQQQGEHRKNAEENHRKPLRSDGIGNDAFESEHPVNGLLAVHFFEHSSNGGYHGLRIALGAYHKAQVSPKNDELVLTLHIRVIKLGLAILAPFGQPELFRVSNDSHNLALSVEGGDREVLSNRILVGKV